MFCRVGWARCSKVATWTKSGRTSPLYWAYHLSHRPLLLENIITISHLLITTPLHHLNTLLTIPPTHLIITHHLLPPPSCPLLPPLTTHMPLLPITNSSSCIMHITPTTKAVVPFITSTSSPPPRYTTHMPCTRPTIPSGVVLGCPGQWGCCSTMPPFPPPCPIIISPMPTLWVSVTEITTLFLITIKRKFQK